MPSIPELPLKNNMLFAGQPPRVLAMFRAVHPGRSLLRRNFAWTFIGNTVYSVCQWGLLSLLAKLTTPERVGEYALAVAVTAPLLYFANFSIGIMLVTDVHRQFNFAQYRSARLLLTAASLVAAAVISYVSRFSADVVEMIMIVAVTQSADCISELYRMVMLRSEQMSRIALSLAIRGLASVAAAGVVLFCLKSIFLALTAIAVVRISVLCLYDIPMGRDESVSLPSPEARKTDLRLVGGSSMQRLIRVLSLPAVLEITRAALPVTIITVLASIVTNLPRYFIEHYAGHRQLGIFAAMWSLLTAGNMVAIALAQAIFPRLSKLYAGQDMAAFRRLIGSAIQIGLALGLVGVGGAIVAGKQILTLAYRPEYAQERGMFVAVMGVGSLVYMSTLLGNVASSARAFRSQALLMTVVAATTLLCSLVLVPKLGVWGAIWAAGIGCVSHVAGLMFIVLALLKRRDRIKTVLLLAPGRA